MVLELMHKGDLHHFLGTLSSKCVSLATTENIDNLSSFPQGQQC